MPNKTYTRWDWLHVLSVMIQYRRTEGYVDEVNGKLHYFDSDPMRYGVSACHVTIEEVKRYAEEKD